MSAPKRSEWEKIYLPGTEFYKVSASVTECLYNGPAAFLEIEDCTNILHSQKISIPIESAAAARGNTNCMEQKMETPKYVLEAVSFWDYAFKKGPRKYSGPVKRFCAYGATEYGTDLDAVKVLDLRAVALMDLADKFARFSRMISRAGLAANN